MATKGSIEPKIVILAQNVQPPVLLSSASVQAFGKSLQVLLMTMGYCLLKDTQSLWHLRMSLNDASHNVSLEALCETSHVYQIFISGNLILPEKKQMNFLNRINFKAAVSLFIYQPGYWQMNQQGSSFIGTILCIVPFIFILIYNRFVVVRIDVLSACYMLFVWYALSIYRLVGYLFILNLQGLPDEANATAWCWNKFF